MVPSGFLVLVSLTVSSNFVSKSPNDVLLGFSSETSGCNSSCADGFSDELLHTDAFFDGLLHIDAFFDGLRHIDGFSDDLLHIDGFSDGLMHIDGSLLDSEGSRVTTIGGIEWTLEPPRGDGAKDKF